MAKDLQKMTLKEIKDDLRECNRDSFGLGLEASATGSYDTTMGRVVDSRAGELQGELRRRYERNPRLAGSVAVCRCLDVSYRDQSRSELQNRFQHASLLLFGDGPSAWRLHPSCKNLDQTPGKRDFLIKCFCEEMKADEAIDWGLKSGYRPAIHKELIAFAGQGGGPFRIVALGSYVLKGSPGKKRHRFVSMYEQCFGIADDRFAKTWPASTRFLFVRMSA